VPSYLTLVEFKEATIAPAVDVDGLEAKRPGYLLRRLTATSGWINAHLRKRYACPFAAPVPDTVTNWLQQIVTFELYLARGVDPADQSIEHIKEAHDTAKKEVADAAGAEDNRWDLPLREDADGTAITKGGPLAYTETSPYVAFDLQREIGRGEDRR